MLRINHCNDATSCSLPLPGNPLLLLRSSAFFQAHVTAHGYLTEADVRLEWELNSRLVLHQNRSQAQAQNVQLVFEEVLSSERFWRCAAEALTNENCWCRWARVCFFSRLRGHSGTTEAVVLCSCPALTPPPNVCSCVPRRNKTGSNQYLHARSGFCLLQVPMIPSASTSTRRLRWVPSNRRRCRTLFLFSARWPRS